MFLDRASVRRDERGSALMAVIAVMGVTLTLAILVAAVSIQALGFTSATRAGVQSKAAAQSGIDAAVLSILNGACAADTQPGQPAGVLKPGTVASSASGAGYTASYSVTVQVPNAAGSFVTGCPAADSTAIKIVAEGKASARGVAGNSGNDSHKLEALYAAVVSSGGPAIYSYASSTLNNFVVTTTTVDADVQVKTGDMSCVSASIQGNVHVASGSITIESSCKVTGSIYASGDIIVRGYIGGNVNANGKVTMSSGARVGGSLTAGGIVVHDNGFGCGPAGDSAPQRARCYLGTTPVSWTAYVPGAPNAPQVKGGVAGISFNVPGVTPPSVPAWQDYRFNPATWVAAGYSVVPMPASWCMIGNTNAAAVQAAVNNLTTKTVYNATSVCGSDQLLFSSSASLHLQLKTDVAFIAPPSIGLEGVRVSSADGARHQFALITPDASPANNRQPDKPNPGCNVNVNSGVVINPNISALIYSPCKVKNSANGWRGQLYAGITDLDSAVAISFDAVSVPGLNLSGTGPLPGDEISSVLSNRTYLRDLDG